MFKYIEVKRDPDHPSPLKIELDYLHCVYFEATMTTITIDIDCSSENHFPSQSIFCEICCSEEIPPEYQTICPKGHTFCITCAGMMAQRQITNYQKTLPCMSMEEECQAEFTEEEAKKFLNQILFKRWKELQIELFAKELGIEEPLEFCPFCDFYRVILEPNKSKIFICGNQECKKWSCRECKTEDHLPLTCEGEFFFYTKTFRWYHSGS